MNTQKEPLLYTASGQPFNFEGFQNVPSKIRFRDKKYSKNPADEGMEVVFFEGCSITGLDEYGQFIPRMDNYVSVKSSEWDEYVGKVEEGTDNYLNFTGRFPEHWEHFLKIKDGEVGSPITSVTSSPQLIMSLKAIGITTVEKLVSCSLEDLKMVRGGIELRQKAELHLDKNLALEKVIKDKKDTEQELQRIKKELESLKTVSTGNSNESDDPAGTKIDSDKYIIRGTERNSKQSK